MAVYSIRNQWSRRRFQTYPDAQASLGSRIGQFNRREWWHATGKARDAFNLVETAILGQLQVSFIEMYCGIIHFGLFMIGKDAASAKPTIMFFCETKGPRKRAKKIIDNGGLLERLPGFRTGHRNKQPMIGSLVQPATQEDSKNESASINRHTEIYFDPSCEVRAIGMPIYVKQINGSFRRATAYTVFKDDRCMLMSVSHVFCESTHEESCTPSIDDSDYYLGSGTESETESDDEINKKYSGSERSSKDSTNQSSAIHSQALDCSGQTNETYVMELPERASVRPTPILPPPAVSLSGQELSDRLAAHDPLCLELLGTLIETSVDQDWAVIDITNQSVELALKQDHSIPRHSHVADKAAYSQCIVYSTASSLACMHGILLESTIYMRLPGSSTFREVYHVTLNGRINWGDCGAVVLDASISAPYGHVVASSNDRDVAFIMPATQILEASRTIWRPSTILSPAKHNRSMSLQQTRASSGLTPESTLPHHSLHALAGVLHSPLDQSSRLEVIQSLWPDSVTIPQTVEPSDWDAFFVAYTNECNAALFDQGRHLGIRTHKDLLDICALLRTQATKEHMDMKIRQKFTIARDSKEEDMMVNGSLNLAARVLAMIKVGSRSCEISGELVVPWRQDQSLYGAVSMYFDLFSNSEVENVVFGSDFTARNINQISKIEIIWTNNLADHLRLVEKDRKLCVFHHVTFLRRMEDAPSPIIPNDLVSETLDTLKLLFPSADKKTKRWLKVKRQADLVSANLDTGLLNVGHFNAGHPSRRLENFRFWHDRLAMLKEAFDENTPASKTLLTVWRDRRDRTQWLTFYFAVIAISLTLFFGLVQSIEGAIQVWKAYHPTTG